LFYNSNNWYHSCAIKINPANLSSSLTDVETTWKKIFPDQLYNYDFLDNQIAMFYEMDNMILRLTQVFAGIAIVICCLGLYGLVSFMAAQKTKEVGVRKVLGARVQSILVVVWKGVHPPVDGGLPGSWTVSLLGNEQVAGELRVSYRNWSRNICAGNSSYIPGGDNNDRISITEGCVG
jgi:hypothetical protein